MRHSLRHSASMKNVVSIALTAFLGVSIVVAYRVYQTSKQRKNRKKPPVAPHRKLKRTEQPVPNQQKGGSGEKASKECTPLRHTGSDILHPAPFDNVTGTMTVPKCNRAEQTKKLSKEDDNSSSSSTKLEGSRMESESQEIKKMPYSFEKCETATFEPAKKEEPKKINDDLPSSLTSIPTVPEPTKTSDKSPEEVSKPTEQPSAPVAPAAPDDSEKSTVENKMARMMGSNEKSSSNESTEPVKQVPPAATDAPLENLSSPSSHNNPSSALNESATPSVSTSSSISSEPSKLLYKACRCRKTARGAPLSNADAPAYDAAVVADVPETKVLPLIFTKYVPPNLLEPPSKKEPAALKELPEEYFVRGEPKSDTYLTPLLPVLGAIHAAHNHACLINNLIENYDFFE